MQLPSLPHRLAPMLFVFVCFLLAATPGLRSSDPVAAQSSATDRVSALVWATAARLQQAGISATDEPSAVRVSANGEIGLEVHVHGPTAEAAAAIAALGVRVGAWSADWPRVAAWARPDQIAELAALPQIVRVEPMFVPRLRSGEVVSEGDLVLRAAETRLAFGLSGKGVRIGVISDGVGALGTSQARGELPPTCTATLLSEAASCVLVDPDNPGDLDQIEGVAMMEIIHDLAPDAVLGFSSGFTDGVSGFIRAIDFLQHDFQADVIVDDIGYVNEPFFEDGIIATRAQQAVDAGVVFVSAAGNDAQQHYQAPLAVSGTCAAGQPRTCLHAFAPGDTTQTLTLPPGDVLQVWLQWSNPFNNTVQSAQQLDDLNLYLLDTSKRVLAAATDVQENSLQPIEMLDYRNSTTSSQTVDLVIDAAALRSGSAPLIEMLFFTSSNLEYRSAADSIYGHPAAAGVIAVGAVAARTPTIVETYSSQGPVTIARPGMELRAKPELVSTDCVVTQVPGFVPFCGTSAAAPHVAALAALLLESEPTADPARIRDLLGRSAVDLGEPGFDYSFGAGRADAMAAVQNSIITSLSSRLFLPLIVRSNN